MRPDEEALHDQFDSKAGCTFMAGGRAIGDDFVRFVSYHSPSGENRLLVTFCWSANLPSILGLPAIARRQLVNEDRVFTR